VATLTWTPHDANAVPEKAAASNRATNRSEGNHLMRPILTLALSAAAAIALTASPAFPQNAKSFVSITGNDSNTCATDALPCRTLPGAIGKTNPGGIIYCLDAGDFTSGTLQILKSIVIDCANTGGLLRAGNVAINIQAVPTDVITIRGLKIFSAVGPVILMSDPGQVGSLRIEDCDLVTGTAAQPVVKLGGGAPNANVFEVLFVNTTVSGGTAGIQIQPDGGGAKITLDRVRAFNSGIGVNVVGTLATTPPNLRVTIKDSTITGNTNQGILATSTNGVTRVLIQDSLVAQNGTGLQANGAKAFIYVLASTIAQNQTGLSALNGGGLVSFGNNALSINNSGNGGFTKIPLQ
jgi:hypothetical protein